VAHCYGVNVLFKAAAVFQIGSVPVYRPEDSSFGPSVLVSFSASVRPLDRQGAALLPWRSESGVPRSRPGGAAASLLPPRPAELGRARGGAAPGEGARSGLAGSDG